MNAQADRRMQDEIARRTPKPKRMRPAAVKRDPVIAALIAKLPAENGPFNRAQRVNWLRMMAMAMDGAFGVELSIAIDQLRGRSEDLALIDLPNPLPTSPAPISGPADPDEIRYFVDKDGFARKEPGNTRIKPFDIPPGDTLEDEREDDDSLDTIKWADGQWPPAAYPNPLTIVKA